MTTSAVTRYTPGLRGNARRRARSAAMPLALLCAITLAAGVGVARTPRLTLALTAALGAALVIPLLSTEALFGVWLAGKLVDPAIPSIGGLGPSDAILLVIVARQVISPRSRRRLPSGFYLVATATVGSETLLTLFGGGGVASEARYVVTLASLFVAAALAMTAIRLEAIRSALFAASGVAALLGAMQYASYKLTGHVPFEQSENLFYIRTGLGSVFRSTGFGTDSNFLAMWILPGIAISAYSSARSMNPRRHYAYVGLCLLGVWSTGSRGGLLAAIGGVLLSFGVAWFGKQSSPSRRVAMVLSAIVLAALFTPTAIRLASREAGRYPATIAVRLGQAPAVVSLALRGNWFGRGHGAQLDNPNGVASPYLRPQNVVHNTALQDLYEAGWAGFLAAVLLLSTGLVASVRCISRGRVRGLSGVLVRDTETAAALGCAFITLAIGLQTVGGLFMRPLWFAWAGALAAAATTAPRASAGSEVDPR